MANHGKSIQNTFENEEDGGPLRVIDIFCIICQLLDVQVAQGNAKKASLLLRYPSDPEVVKVFRNWVSYALLPENMPITSQLNIWWMMTQILTSSEFDFLFAFSVAIGCLFILSLVLVLSCIVCISRKCCRRKSTNALKTTGYKYTQV